MTFSTSVSLFWVAAVSCLIVNAVEENLPLGFNVDRQSKQMNVMPLPLYNYYNPFGSHIWIPTAHSQLRPNQLFSGDSEPELMGRVMKTQDITISPGIGECMAVFPLNKCMRSSPALSGTITINFFSGDQIAVVTISPGKFFYSRVQITCTEMTSGIQVYMTRQSSGDAQFSTTFKTTELKPVLIVVTASTNGGSSTLKCSWSSAF